MTRRRFWKLLVSGAVLVGVVAGAALASYPIFFLEPATIAPELGRAYRQANLALISVGSAFWVAITAIAGVAVYRRFSGSGSSLAFGRVRVVLAGLSSFGAVAVASVVAWVFMNSALDEVVPSDLRERISFSYGWVVLSGLIAVGAGLIGTLLIRRFGTSEARNQTRPRNGE